MNASFGPDRERAVELVQQAYADGRLGPDELERRLELALTATTSQELRPIVADLPDDVVTITNTGGRIVREGDWQVPRRLRVESVYGRVRLDLSSAYVPHSWIDIELRLAYGGATIILPPGASANVDGVHLQWGRMTCKVPGRPCPGALHVRLTGELPYGRLTVRTGRG
ncbi:DUF1707 domain-containing protein [Nonomuraea sp. NN258]|uniref:DUF1707 SHOCT-like domain-containing protein n=1 Tax=Nonomuraea antri TaxID=2730852 RepID=UPI0015680A5D|nr:DUF1707 domain-containing protein [Nonomuraea antri]NRQ32599.1 DUF1707 domain-containing protein [Nonomuraea antri]